MLTTKFGLYIYLQLSDKSSVIKGVDLIFLVFGLVEGYC